MKRNIFYKGFVYIDCNSDPTFSSHDEDTTIGYLKKHYTHYPFIGESTFKDGQDVIENRNYKLQYECDRKLFAESMTEPWWSTCTEEQYNSTTLPKRIVAIPIQTTSSKEETQQVNHSQPWLTGINGIKGKIEETQEDLWEHVWWKCDGEFISLKEFTDHIKTLFTIIRK